MRKAEATLANLKQQQQQTEPQNVLQRLYSTMFATTKKENLPSKPVIFDV